MLHRPTIKKLLICAVLLIALLSLCACDSAALPGKEAGGSGTEAQELSAHSQDGALPAARPGEILSYEQALAAMGDSPDMVFTYTISLPGGSEFGPYSAVADLSGLDSADVEAAAALLPNYPGLESIVLAPGSFTAEEVGILCCDGRFETEYSFTLGDVEIDYYAESVDLSTLPAEFIPQAREILPYLPNLLNVELGAEGSSAFTWDDIEYLVHACENADFHYQFSLYGTWVRLRDRKLDLSYIPITDNGEALLNAARGMYRLVYVDMDSCGLSNARMKEIRQALPRAKVVWRVWFGDKYSVRTDVTKILASKPSGGGFVTDKDGEALSCCIYVKHLDLGHNDFLSDVSFIASMPQLETLILAMDPIRDISPLANCPRLEYLELQTNDYLLDISPLANCPELAHLNIARCRNLSDMSALMGLEKLERLWLGSINQIPASQLEAFRTSHPDCEINTTVWSDPTSEGWRISGMDPWTNEIFYHPRYELLMEQFGYLEEDYAFYWKDPKFRG